MANLSFRKAARKQAKIKIGLQGSSGSGKSWIFRSIVRHDSAAKYATHSAGKVASVPLERLPLIPLQSTPL